MSGNRTPSAPPGRRWASVLRPPRRKFPVVMPRPDLVFWPKTEVERVSSRQEASKVVATPILPAPYSSAIPVPISATPTRSRQVRGSRRAGERGWLEPDGAGGSPWPCQGEGGGVARAPAQRAPAWRRHRPMPGPVREARALRRRRGTRGTRHGGAGIPDSSLPVLSGRHTPAASGAGYRG